MSPPFAISDITLHTRIGVRGAMVVTPTRAIAMGSEALERLRGPQQIGAMDRAIIDAAARMEDARLMIFRARSDDGHAWGFDDALSDQDATELGYLLVRAQTPVYRRLAATGLTLNVHVEWPIRELDAFRGGVVQRLQELDVTLANETGEALAIARADAWILRNLTFYFQVSYAKVIGSVLPDQLPLAERKAERMEQLIAALPDRALE